MKVRKGCDILFRNGKGGAFHKNMEQTSHTSGGTRGLDVFKIAGRSISGYLHSFKTAHASHVRIPFTTLLEERLAFYLEYHPFVRWYQRGDASQVFAQAHKIETPLGTPYIINYVFEEKPHEYLPDFVGTFCDGGLLIAEAGLEAKKQLPQALAKAAAAQRFAQMKGGAYWIGTEANLSVRRHNNLLFLHARRQPFPTCQEIVETLLKQWPWGETHTISEFLQLFGSRWSEREVEAAFWKLVGDMAAEGRLLVDLTQTILDRTVPSAFLDPHTPPILPDALPSSLSENMPDDTVLHEQREIGHPDHIGSIRRSAIDQIRIDWEVVMRVSRVYKMPFQMA